MAGLTPEQLYVSLGRLIEQTPATPDQYGIIPGEVLKWLGQAHVLVKEADVGIDATTFTIEMANLNTTGRRWAFENIKAIVYRALAHAELNAPAAAQGAFLPVGQPFDAFAAIGKILSAARSRVRIIDPYLDANALSDFAVLAAEGVEIQLLADEQGAKPGFKPAVEKWTAQYGAARPVVARLTPPRSLHDRLITVDDIEFWIVTQSLNAIASRSPASISRATAEVAQLKLEYYEQVWGAARAV